MTCEEAAPLFKRSRSYLYEMIKRELIPPAAVLRIGSRIYLRRTILMKWLSGEHEEVDEASQT